MTNLNYVEYEDYIPAYYSTYTALHGVYLVYCAYCIGYAPQIGRLINRDYSRLEDSRCAKLCLHVGAKVHEAISLSYCDKDVWGLRTSGRSAVKVYACQLSNQTSDLTGGEELVVVTFVYLKEVNGRGVRYTLNSWGLHLVCYLFRRSKGIWCPSFLLYK